MVKSILKNLLILSDVIKGLKDSNQISMIVFQNIAKQSNILLNDIFPVEIA